MTVTGLNVAGFDRPFDSPRPQTLHGSRFPPRELPPWLWDATWAAVLSGSALLGAAEEARYLVERPLCRREADSLEGTRRPQRFQPLERKRQVGAALGRDERVNLIDDDRIDGGEPCPGVRRQQQEQRFRSRDQNVCRIAEKARAFACRRVAGSNRDLAS